MSWSVRDKINGTEAYIAKISKVYKTVSREEWNGRDSDELHGSVTVEETVLDENAVKIELLSVKLKVAEGMFEDVIKFMNSVDAIPSLGALNRDEEIFKVDYRKLEECLQTSRYLQYNRTYEYDKDVREVYELDSKEDVNEVITSLDGKLISSVGSIIKGSVYFNRSKRGGRIELDPQKIPAQGQISRDILRDILGLED